MSGKGLGPLYKYKLFTGGCQTCKWHKITFLILSYRNFNSFKNPFHFGF